MLQLNTTGAVVSTTTSMAALVDEIDDVARCPVAIWVGPSGSRANGPSASSSGPRRVTGMAPGTRIGNFGDPLEVPRRHVEYIGNDRRAAAHRRPGRQPRPAAAAPSGGVDDIGHAHARRVHRRCSTASTVERHDPAHRHVVQRATSCAEPARRAGPLRQARPAAAS